MGEPNAPRSACVHRVLARCRVPGHVPGCRCDRGRRAEQTPHGLAGPPAAARIHGRRLPAPATPAFPLSPDPISAAQPAGRRPVAGLSYPDRDPHQNAGRHRAHPRVEATGGRHHHDARWQTLVARAGQPCHGCRLLAADLHSDPADAHRQRGRREPPASAVAPVHRSRSEICHARPRSGDEPLCSSSRSDSSSGKWPRPRLLAGGDLGGRLRRCSSPRCSLPRPVPSMPASVPAS